MLSGNESGLESPLSIKDSTVMSWNPDIPKLKLAESTSDGIDQVRYETETFS